MPARNRIAGWGLLALTLTAGAPAAALEADVGRALAVEHFRALYGFDSLEAYEARFAGASAARFSVARSWSSGNPEILIDIRTPVLDTLGWSALLLPHLDRPADMFVYVPPVRRVRRLSALPPKVQPFFAQYAEFQPIRPAELFFARRADEEIGGETCVVVEAVPRGRSLSYSHISLAFSPRSPIAVRTVYYEREREVRRVLVDPDDLERFGEQQVAAKRRIELWDGTTLELHLRNAVIGPELPESLFRRHNLEFRRLPRF